MDCREVRTRLDRGTAPGAHSPEQARLGFHLASCPRCRSYRAVAEAHLLATLLDVPLPAAPTKPDPEPPLPPTRRHRHRIALFAGGALLMAALLIALPLLRSLLRIQENVQAMYVALPSATAAVSPSATVPATATAPAQPSQPAGTATAATPNLPPATIAPIVTVQPTQTPRQELRPAPASGGPLTVLLLGSDQRPDEAAAARTDAIIVARIDPQSERVALLSLPRDLWVDIPGYGQGRINSAFGLGESSGVPGAGIALSRATISQLLGIPIDRYVYINFSGFTSAIDAIGGVTIDVTKELYDDQYPTMDYSYMTVHFLPGTQHMDGETALIYSRIRHPDSDFQRMQRQQQVIAAVLDQVRGNNIFEAVEQVESLTTIMQHYVKTDLNQGQLLGLAWAMRSLRPDDVERYVLDEAMVNFGIGSDQWAETALPGSIESLVEKLLGSPVAHNEHVPESE